MFTLQLGAAAHCSLSLLWQTGSQLIGATAQLLCSDDLTDVPGEAQTGFDDRLTRDTRALFALKSTFRNLDIKEMVGKLGDNAFSIAISGCVHWNSAQETVEFLDSKDTWVTATTWGYRGPGEPSKTFCTETPMLTQECWVKHGHRSVTETLAE